MKSTSSHEVTDSWRASIETFVDLIASETQKMPWSATQSIVLLVSQRLRDMIRCCRGSHCIDYLLRLKTSHPAFQGQEAWSLLSDFCAVLLCSQKIDMKSY